MYVIGLGSVQMQSGSMQQLLSNPEAIEAAMQIQQGMMRLQNTAPGVLGQGSVSSLMCVVQPGILAWFPFCFVLQVA